MKIFSRLILLFLLVFLVLAPSHAMGQFFMSEHPLLGQPAPDFTLKTSRQNEESLTQYRKNNSAIIFFWATWCSHCREQLAGLDGKFEELGKKNIKIVLVDVGENAKQVNAYVDAHKIDFDVFLDEQQVVSLEYSIVGVPTFFFINNEGVIQAVEHFLPDNYEEILSNGSI